MYRCEAGAEKKASSRSQKLLDTALLDLDTKFSRLRRAKGHELEYPFQNAPPPSVLDKWCLPIDPTYVSRDVGPTVPWPPRGECHALGVLCVGRLGPRCRVSDECKV